MTARYSEDDLIARLFAPIAGPAGLGLIDDAALLPPSAEQKKRLKIEKEKKKKEQEKN
jgi:hypothetical protein